MDRVRTAVSLSWGWSFPGRRLFIRACGTFPGVELAQEFRTGPDRIAVFFQNEDREKDLGLLQLSSTSQGAFVVGMPLGSQHNAAVMSDRSIGIEQSHRAEVRLLLRQAQQFLARKLDRARHRPVLTFPILNGTAT